MYEQPKLTPITHLLRKGSDEAQNYWLNPPTYARRFSPSSLSVRTDDGSVYGECNRKLALQNFGFYLTKKGLATSMKMQFGDHFEDMLASKYAQFIVIRQPRVQFMFGEDFKYEMSGFADVILNIDNKHIGAEIKSTGEEGKAKLIDGYKHPPKEARTYLLEPMAPAPMIGHILQSSVYEFFYKYVRPYFTPFYGFIEPIDEWRIFYGLRGSMKFAEYRLTIYEDEEGYHRPLIEKITDGGEDTFEVTPVLIKPFSVESILERCEDLGKAIETHTIPERDYLPSYDGDDIDFLRDSGKINDSRHKELVKALNYGDQTGDWECTVTCPFRDQCMELPSTELSLEDVPENYFIRQPHIPALRR